MNCTCSVHEFVVKFLTGDGVDQNEAGGFGLDVWDPSTIGLCVALHVDMLASARGQIVRAITTAILDERASARNPGKARLFAAVIHHLEIVEEVVDLLRADETWMRHCAKRGDDDHFGGVRSELTELGVKVPDLLAEAEARYPRTTMA